MVLDVFELCTEDLQKKLVPARDKFKAEEDRKAEELGKKVPGFHKYSLSVTVTEISCNNQLELMNIQFCTP